jgi:hypothetical protein
VPHLAFLLGESLIERAERPLSREAVFCKVFIVPQLNFFQVVSDLKFRVARWHTFKPKFKIYVNFGGPWNEKGCYILWPFGIYYGLMVYVVYGDLKNTYYGLMVHFMAIWQFSGNLVYFPPFGKLYQEKSGNPAKVYKLGCKLQVYKTDRLCQAWWFTTSMNILF